MFNIMLPIHCLLELERMYDYIVKAQQDAGGTICGRECLEEDEINIEVTLKS